jgi:mRNA interferase HicA
MNSKQMMRLAQECGWVLVSQRGSHRKYKHPKYPYPLIIPDHGTDEIGKGLAAKLRKHIKGTT